MQAAELLRRSRDYTRPYGCGKASRLRFSAKDALNSASLDGRVLHRTHARSTALRITHTRTLVCSSCERAFLTSFCRAAAAARR
jgi:hypothetical protein